MDDFNAQPDRLLGGRALHPLTLHVVHKPGAGRLFVIIVQNWCQSIKGTASIMLSRLDLLS
jgi:hypothetical protein